MPPPGGGAAGGGALGGMPPLGGGLLGGGMPPPPIVPPVPPIWKPPLDCTFCQAPYPIATSSTRPTKEAQPGEFVRARMNFNNPKAATPRPRKPLSLSGDIVPMFMLAIEPVIESTPTTIRAIASRPARIPKREPLPCHMLKLMPRPIRSPSPPRS